jgi:hypothetical protein
MPRLTAKPTEIQQYLATLEATPRRIAAAVAGQDEARLRANTDRQTWSAVEILAHLRGCADVWTQSIYAMLNEEHPSLPLQDPRRWAKAMRYASLDFQPSLQAFSLQRAELVRVLHTIPEDKWNRTCDIGGRTHSVFSQVRRMALHESEHCAQLEALLATNKDILAANSDPPRAP